MHSHNLLPPLRLVASGGPVSRSVRAMEAAHRAPVLQVEHDDGLAEIRRLREAIRNQIERDFDRIDRCLSLLDAIDGDPDLEPSLSGGPTPGEGGDDRELDDADLEDGADQEDDRADCEDRHQPPFMRGGGYSEGAF